MPKHIPSLKPRELIRILEAGGCSYLSEGKGDHRLYFRYHEGKRRVVPIDMGVKEFSPPYVLRIFRQSGFSDDEIEALLKSNNFSLFQLFSHFLLCFKSNKPNEG